MLENNFKLDENFYLKINSLNYKYSSECNYALKNVNMRIKGLSNIGIIGYSGSGKSTLINILGGFLQPEKENIDMEINGIDIKHLTQNLWQDEVIYIPQNPHIFSMSILDNIRFYSPDKSVEEVRFAAEKVGMLSFIESLEKGFFTKIGEGGRSLSGGQEQRIALARAFLSKERKIILFDEPTAHLDIETEVELKKYILELSENRLMFFSTHRLHWMKEMDYIYVIEDGQIVEDGNLKKLIEKKDKFIKLSNKMRGETFE